MNGTKHSERSTSREATLDTDRISNLKILSLVLRSRIRREAYKLARRRILPMAGQLMLSPELREWRRLDGNLSLRLDYPIQPSDTVVDAGGFKGQFASDIYARFRCRVHVYEPIEEFASIIERRFAANPDIAIHKYGLAGSKREENLYVDEDATSSMVDSGKLQQVSLASVVDEVDAVGDIALMELNIEGGEYEVLEALIASGRIKRIRYLQIQFHDFVPNAVDRRQSVLEGLSSSHSVQWVYPFLWESWKRLDP